MTRSARFRELMRNPPFISMGAHDALTGMLAEQCGAPSIYVSGFVASGIIAGAPDIGLLSQTEMFDHIRRICRVTSVPVFADADTGYGSVLDCQRTMRLWEEAGASVLHLEDQAIPKKCGHFAGKQLISIEEMQQKLRAMLQARRDPDFFIVARTDAIAVTGIDDAIDRLSKYAEVGVDGLYADAPESIEHMKALTGRLKKFGKPILFNMVTSGKSPVLTLQDAYELGFSYAICPVEPMLAMHKAVKTMMERFMASGCTTKSIAELMTPFHDYNEFVGLSKTIAREKQFMA